MCGLCGCHLSYSGRSRKKIDYCDFKLLSQTQVFVKVPYCTSFFNMVEKMVGGGGYAMLGGLLKLNAGCCFNSNTKC